MRIICACIAIVTILACGGGGGGGGGASQATLQGRALSIETGSASNPKSSVQVGSASVITEDDGSFELKVPTGTTAATIDTRSPWGTFSYTFPAATGIVDVGDWWVGPAKVAVEGRVVSSVNGSVIEGVVVSFAGRQAATGTNGRFRLTNVAYSAATQTVFWGIAGSATKTGFFSTQFSTQPNKPIAGVVTVADIVMTPSSDIDPPPTPANIWGRITPSLEAPGAVATLKQAGTPVRVYLVGNDATYRFWVPPGTYTIEITKGALSANASATLSTVDQVVRKDVTLQ